MLEGSKFIQIGLRIAKAPGWERVDLFGACCWWLCEKNCLFLKIFRTNSEEIVLHPHKFSYFQGECFEAF